MLLTVFSDRLAAISHDGKIKRVTRNAGRPTKRGASLRRPV